MKSVCFVVEELPSPMSRSLDWEDALLFRWHLFVQCTASLAFSIILAPKMGSSIWWYLVRHPENCTFACRIPKFFSWTKPQGNFLLIAPEQENQGPGVLVHCSCNAPKRLPVLFTCGCDLRMKSSFQCTGCREWVPGTRSFGAHHGGPNCDHNRAQTLDDKKCRSDSCTGQRSGGRVWQLQPTHGFWWWIV